MRQCDSCGERGSGFGEVGCNASDDRTGDREGEEDKGGALRGEGRAAAEDWVSVMREMPCHEDACVSIPSVTPASGMVAISTTATVRRYLRWQISLGTATTATFALAFIRNAIA